mgnify:CR=1 FL=1
MRLRLMDEVMPLDGRGILLLSMDEENAPLLQSGARITDARGGGHTVGPGRVVYAPPARRRRGVF